MFRGFSFERIVSRHYKNFAHVKLTTKIKSKIFGFFVGNFRQFSNIYGNLRQFWGIFGSLRESSEISQNRRRMSKTL